MTTIGYTYRDYDRPALTEAGCTDIWEGRRPLAQEKDTWLPRLHDGDVLIVASVRRLSPDFGDFSRLADDLAGAGVQVRVLQQEG